MKNLNNVTSQQLFSTPLKTGEIKVLLGTALKAMSKAHARTRSPFVRENLEAAREFIQITDVGSLAQRKFADGWDAAILKLAQLPEQDRASYIEVYITTNKSDDNA